MDAFASCLEKLDVLKSMGHLTDREYDAQRQKLVDDYVGQPMGAARKAQAAPRAARRVALPPSVTAALARARGGIANPYALAYAPPPHMVMGGVPRGPFTRTGGYAPYPPTNMPPKARGPKAAVKVVPIPEGIQVEEVIANFEPFGTVTSAVIKEGTPRFAYVNFASAEDAKGASHAHIVLLGQLCTLSLKRSHKPPVAEGEPSDGIGVFNIPFAMTQAEITDMLSAHPGFQTLRYITTKMGQFRGYVFAYFDTVEHAMEAKMMLLGSNVQGQVLDVKYSNRRKEDVGVP